MINRALFVLFLHSAALAGTVSPVVLIGPSHFALTIPQMVSRSVMTSNPSFLPQMKAVVSNIPSPMYALKAEGGFGVIPQRATAKAVLVPFKSSPGKPESTIPLTNKAAAELRSQLKRGDILAAQASLNKYFDNAFEKARAEKDAVEWARGFFEIRTLTDLEDIRGTVVTKVRKTTTLPQSVRAELAKGKDRVVYSVVLDGNKSFAVFSSKSNSFGARGTLFGAKGQNLGRVTTRNKLNAWEKEHLDAFQRALEPSHDDDYDAEERFQTHSGRHP
jgi:hypothetical protein